MGPKTCRYYKKTPTGTKSCGQPARWRLHLVLTDNYGISNTLSTPLHVCNRHRTELTPNNVLDKRTWRDVVGQVLRKGYEKPRRGLTKLHYTKSQDKALTY